MPITIKEIQADIAAGRSKVIYFSPACLWWTHLRKDALEATERGHIFQIEVAKRKGRVLYIPPEPDGYTDPIGTPVKVFPSAKTWFKRSMSNPLWYGKHGLKAFLKTHHQNTADFFANNWAAYNARIDQGK